MLTKVQKSKNLHQLNQNKKSSHSFVRYIRIKAGNIDLKLHSDLDNFEQFTWSSLVKKCLINDLVAAQKFLDGRSITVKHKNVKRNEVASSTFEFVDGFAQFALLRALPEKTSNEMMINIKFDEDADPRVEARAYLNEADMMANPPRDWPGKFPTANALAVLLSSKSKNNSKRVKKIIRNGTKVPTLKAEPQKLLGELEINEK